MTRPVAYLHTLHMEGGQKSTRVEFSKENSWGVPGRDYSAEYKVTIEPLYRAPKKKGRKKRPSINRTSVEVA